jgi:hypothetical protein
MSIENRMGDISHTPAKKGNSHHSQGDKGEKMDVLRQSFNSKKPCRIQFYKASM